MAIKNWSENIIEVDLTDEPQFSEDLGTVIEEVKQTPRHVVLNMARVTYLNSSSIAELLRAQKAVTVSGQRLKLCAVDSSVWGVLKIAGLDRIFQTAPDLMTAIAGIQIGE